MDESVTRHVRKGKEQGAGKGRDVLTACMTVTEGATIDRECDALAPLAEIDQADLDILDDTARHAACALCFPPNQPPGSVFVALCGKRSLTSLHPSTATPANACRECQQLWWAECGRCGR